MKTINLQTAIFLGSHILRPDKIYTEIDKHLGGPFTAVPTIIPIPQDAPAEIPVVQMSDNKNLFNCNIARSRIDLFLNNLNQTSDNESNIVKYFNLSKRLATYVISINTMTRIGLVSNSFLETIDPVQLVSNKYLLEKDNMDELTIRFNKRKTAFSMVFNDIYDISSNSITNGGQTKTGILIQRDINSVIVPGFAFNKLNSVQIIDYFSKELLPESVRRLI